MFKRFLPILTITAAAWMLFFINNGLWSGELTQHGIIPRHLSGVPGILWAPFLHASFRTCWPTPCRFWFWEGFSVRAARGNSSGSPSWESS